MNRRRWTTAFRELCSRSIDDIGKTNALVTDPALKSDA